MLKKLLMCSVLIISVSCSSSKKTNSPLSEGEIYDDHNSGLALQGDSDSGQAGGLKTIYFDYRSASLSKESQRTLEENAEILKGKSSIRLQIEGHADERGSAQFNLTLGEKRARAVYDFLLGKGIERKRLSVLSLGKERPIAFGHDEEAWSKNRRANFVITN